MLRKEKKEGILCYSFLGLEGVLILLGIVPCPEVGLHQNNSKVCCLKYTAHDHVSW